jgi:PIN domain nuclease of toxin-antitoxin system
MLLPTHARTQLEDSGNTLLLSTASDWKMGVKHALGRLRLPNNLPPADFIPEARSLNGVDTPPITEGDALQLPKRPRIHQDPFDRMLILSRRARGENDSGGFGTASHPVSDTRFPGLSLKRRSAVRPDARRLLPRSRAGVRPDAPKYANPFPTLAPRPQLGS